MRRWLRRLVVAVGALVVLLTLAPVAYNAVAAGREVSATKLYAGPFVRIDGTAIAYRRWGKRGTPIVLLGGFIESAWVWHSVGPLLAKRHRVYALDLPPFGYSQRRGPYTIGRWARLVQDFDAHFQLVRPTLVGHSLGAAVVVAIRANEPRHTSRIVLLDGDARPGGGPGGWISDLLAPPWYTSIYRIATGSDWIFRRGLKSAWSRGTPPYSNAFIDHWQRPFRVSGSAAAYRSMLGHGIQGLSAATLRRVRVPRIVLWGAQDRVDSPEAGRRTAALLRARFVVVPGAGHLSLLQAPTAVARAIARFVEGAP